jgi:hypothetical protein
MTEIQIKKYLERFDQLSDDAVAPTKIASIILGLSDRSVRYHPNLQRIYVSKSRYGFRIGDIRKLAREGV